MIVFESRKVRHVVARLDSGEDLVEALVALATERAIGAAWVAGFGVLESCELTGYDAGSQVYYPARRVNSSVDIVNLTGNISFENGAPSVLLYATVSRSGGGEVQVYGGRLLRGRAFACELRLDVYDDIALGREHDAKTGLSLWAGEGTPVGGNARVQMARAALAAASARHDAVKVAGAPTAQAASPAKAETMPPPAPGASADGAVSWAQVADASADAPEPAPSARPQNFAETVTAAPAVQLPRPSLAERRREAKIRQTESKQAERKQRAAGSKRAMIGVPGPTPLPSRKRKSEDEFFDELVPETGDFVDHKVFGLCRVEGEGQTGGLIIRLENGSRKAIKLDYLEVSPPRVDDRARRVFTLRPRRRTT